VLLHAFLQGLAGNLESEAQAQSDTGLSEQEHMRAQEARFKAVAASGTVPYFAKMLGELSTGFELDFDALFELGLKVMLDGVAALMAGSKRSGR